MRGKSLLCLLLCALLLSACGGNPQSASMTPLNPTAAEEPELDTTSTEADIAQLEALYEGRTAFYGDMHAHSSTGTADGKISLSEIKLIQMRLDMDFTSVIDHYQVLHMQDAEWDNTLFVGGAEPGATITDCPNATINRMDYAMIFAEPEGLEKVLNTYPLLYQYSKAKGTFSYMFVATHSQVAEVAQCIMDHGGFFVHVHPRQKSYYNSTEPMDYFFVDGAGFEVHNGLNSDMNDQQNVEAYEIWLTLLRNGKRIYATSGSDMHANDDNVLRTLTTIYAESHEAKNLVPQMCTGDFSAGPVGIRMAVGDAVTGASGSFAGNRLVVAVGDFHSQALDATHTYRVDLYAEDECVVSRDLDVSQMNYLAIDADPGCRYYRANVYDVTAECIVAVGNPVWNQ